MPRIFATLFLALAVAFTACSDDDNGSTGPETPLNVQLAFTNLPTLGDDYFYQVWLLTGSGYAYPAGKFNIQAGGQLVDTEGSDVTDNTFQISIYLDDVEAVGITLEPAEDSTTDPSSTHLLGGDVETDGTAALTVDHYAGMDMSFDGISGFYILATPTNGGDSHEGSGVWFVDLSTGLPRSGLTLPEPATGWKYEGWVEIDGTPVSTGTFTEFSAADDTSRYGGAETGHTFPGEDFLQNAPSGLTFPTDLLGDRVYITVEPDPDETPDEPFLLKALQADIGSDAEDHQTYDLQAVSGFAPTGTVTLTQ